MVKKKIVNIFFYLTPIFIIFGVGVIVFAIMSLVPEAGVRIGSYEKVMGVHTP